MHQKVNWPFGSDSEGVETHKKSTGWSKIQSFDLRWFQSLRSRFSILGSRGGDFRILWFFRVSDFKMPDSRVSDLKF